MHELGEFGLGDVRIRATVANERRELVAIEVVEGEEVRLVERFNARFVRG